MIRPEYHLLLDTRDVLPSNGLLTLIDTNKGVSTYQTKHTFTNVPLLKILQNNMTIRYNVIESVIVEL